MIPFKQKLRKILYERNITILKFCEDIGIDRPSFFYKDHHHSRHIYMAIAYYLGLDVDDLMDGTDALEDFYER